MIFRKWFAAFWLACFFVAGSAQATVIATFYSQDFGDSFPHAFVKLTGTVDSTGEKIDTNWGFTARNIGPHLLFGRAKGKLSIVKQSYIDKSDAHFSVRLSDRQYDALMKTVRKWGTAKQPSYDLNDANCVHFIGDLAQSIGLKINRNTDNWKKPKSFLTETRALNPGVLAPLD